MFKTINPESSIYVELRISEQVRVQEFAPRDERAFVVGSTERASFRLNGAEIAPVQFHLEREDDAIWLIPAYGIADLSVDSYRVLGPTPLNAKSTIEFFGVCMHATIVECDRLGTNDDRFVQQLHGLAGKESPSLSCLGDEDPTIVAVRPTCPDLPIPAVSPARVELACRSDSRAEERSSLAGGSSRLVAELGTNHADLESGANEAFTRAQRQPRQGRSANRPGKKALSIAGAVVIGFVALTFAVLQAVR